MDVNRLLEKKKNRDEDADKINLGVFDSFENCLTLFCYCFNGGGHTI